MKHKYFKITIKGEEPVVVKAEAGSHAGLSYLDFFDACMLWHYFDFGDVSKAPISYKEAERLQRRGARLVPGFQPIYKGRAWR